MCCDGTLFSRVPITRAEAEVMPRVGLEVVRRPHDAFALPLPCSALVGRSCTVYADRPGTCRAFRCKLYLGVEAGTISGAEALRTVADAQALRQQGVDRTLDAFLDEHFLPDAPSKLS